MNDTMVLAVGVAVSERGSGWPSVGADKTRERHDPTHGVWRCEFSFSTTSMPRPPRPGCASTTLELPKSIPSTDMGGDGVDCKHAQAAAAEMCGLWLRARQRSRNIVSLKN